MRSDYMLYAVALICFIITGLALMLNIAEFERNLSVVATVVLGLLFIGLGFMQRPRMEIRSVEVPPSSVMTVPQATTPEVTVEEKVETAQSPPPPPSEPELMKIKGIGPKRVEQLKALNINTIQDLTSASAKTVADKLNISPKITGKWIENAKELASKS